MVYIEYNSNEEITSVTEETRNELKGVEVETDGGYFVYWIPYIDMSEKTYGPDGFVLDLFYMEIEENPNGNTSIYSGDDAVGVPNKVVNKAEEVSGYEKLD